MKNSTKVKWIIFLVYSIFIILAALSAHQANDLSLLTQENSLYISNESFEPDLSMHPISQEEIGLQEYSIYLSDQQFNNMQSDTLVFFLNKLTDNAYQVELNGVIIGSEGDLERGHSMFKNSPNYFSFDRQLLEDENEFIIYTHASYKSGVEAKGVYITDHEVGMKQASKVDLFGTHLIVMGLGILIFSVVVIAFIYFLNPQREIGYLYCAIATLLITIFFMDYIKVVHLPSSYLTFKKVFLISLHLAVWFYMLAMNQYLHSYYLKYASAITAISFIIMSLSVNEFILYKQLYTYWYFALIVNITIGFIYSVINIKKVRQAFSFSATLFYAFIYASLSVWIEYFNYSFSINSPLVYIVIFSSLPLLFGLEELMGKEQRIIDEKDRRKHDYINSMTDDLTGIWNQRFLYKKLNEPLKEVILVMIDIDDFKQVNDTYGHLAGDFVLKEFSRLAVNIIRKTDDVFRYGGDEFIMFLYQCNEIETALRMEKLRQTIENHDFVFEGHLIKVTISVGIYEVEKNKNAEDLLKNVDQQLYKAKQKGKNTISTSQKIN